MPFIASMRALMPLLIYVLLLIGCTVDTNPVSGNEQSMLADDPADDSCEKMNGTKTINGNGMETCYLPTSDAGKACTDSSQCESGFCVTQDESAIEGTCYFAMPISGCWNVLSDGRVGPICD